MIFEPQLLCSHVSAVLSKHILMLFVTRNFEIYFVQNIIENHYAKRSVANIDIYWCWIPLK